MAADFAREAQAAVYSALSGHPALVADIADRVYGEPPQNPNFPYVHIGQISTRPLDTDGTRSAVVSVTVEAHTRGVGQQRAQELLTLAVGALHRQEGAMQAGPGYRIVRVDYLTTAVFRRPDGQGYDGSVAFDIVIDAL